MGMYDHICALQYHHHASWIMYGNGDACDVDRLNTKLAAPPAKASTPVVAATTGPSSAEFEALKK